MTPTTVAFYGAMLIIIIILTLYSIYRQVKINDRIDELEKNQVPEEQLFYLLERYVINLFDYQPTEEEELQSDLEGDTGYETEKSVAKKILVKTREDYQQAKKYDRAVFIPGTQQAKPKNTN